MLGAITSRGVFHKCTTSKTILGTLSSSIVPCDVPNTALQCSLRQSSNHCKSPNHAVPRQGAAPRRTTALKVATRTAVPIRRNVSSSLKTQDADSPSLYDEPSAVHSKQQKTSPDVVQSTMNRSQLDAHDTINVPARVPSVPRKPCRMYADCSHNSTMRRRHAQNCDETFTVDGHDAMNTIKHTGSRVSH